MVEPVGAGDAFAAGFLPGLLQGRTTARALRLGRITAVSTLKVTGDHGSQPAAEDIERLLDLTSQDWQRYEDTATRAGAAGGRQCTGGAREEAAGAGV